MSDSVTPLPTPSPKTSKAKKLDGIAKKWGSACTEVGWTAVPNILIHRQKTLGIDSLDLNILLLLMTYWWQDDKKPYPSKKTIADAIGVQPGTVRRHIAKLESGGLIKRIERRRENNRSDTNEYDLSPLVEVLKPHAETELRERITARAGRKKRMTTVTKPE